jgi:hypothetical protein
MQHTESSQNRNAEFGVVFRSTVNKRFVPRILLEAADIVEQCYDFSEADLIIR